jgi:3-oxoacyl-[acyl-carrier protein] reductase
VASGPQRGCALVTGASRGIGAAIARGLAADGWAVGVNYLRDADSAASVVEAIESAGGRAVAVRADVRDRDAAGLVARVEDGLGLPLLVLVNNAGITRDRSLANLDEEDWDAVLDVNLSAAYRLSHAALRSMAGKRYGRIVNIASVAGQIANPGQAAYAASKAGLVAFTKTAAAELARQSITVNAVAPGLVRTDATEALAGSLQRRVPAGRAGAPEDVAACVRFLVSEQAGYVTGSLLTVDGGLSA